MSLNNTKVNAIHVANLYVYYLQKSASGEADSSWLHHVLTDVRGN